MSLEKEKRAITQLTVLLEQLDMELPKYSVKEYRQLLHDTQRLHRMFTQGRKIMKEMFGFSLELGQSKIAGGGFGVLVKEGIVPPGHLVCLYPGQWYVVLVFAYKCCVGGVCIACHGSYLFDVCACQCVWHVTACAATSSHLSPSYCRRGVTSPYYHQTLSAYADVRRCCG